jgi:hypothetical protein
MQLAAASLQSLHGLLSEGHGLPVNEHEPRVPLQLSLVVQNFPSSHSEAGSEPEGTAQHAPR